MNLIEIQGLLDDEIAGLGLQATFKIRANILGRIGMVSILEFVSSFLETRIQVSSFPLSAGAPNPVPNLAALRDTKVFSVFLDGKVFPQLPLINDII
jgi:hypothetical protein